ncbi:uncharacterized protein BCR38DRAFT_439677 [Pseudomassariella vexata]|uniref:Uncharacterized protein n=1 Tax=Pseudomassariella vexata TaxID=1141098 RepID=A0A1Y2DPQ7_9PEZI|nr:uncharacterized protein BCR38DRAFT_439677 [Pseudomassariella vexata]ORY61240.1 hypothetical protein BCR38DRAFT_439677 [Pseudomassariella vexata]
MMSLLALRPSQLNRSFPFSISNNTRWKASWSITKSQNLILDCRGPKAWNCHPLQAVSAIC